MTLFVCTTRRLMSVAIIAGVGVVAFGCRQSQHTNPPINLPAPVRPNPQAAAESTNSSSKTPVKNSLVALLEQDAQGDHVFPSGVQVKSVTLAEGVATVDFSHEFTQLANSGETVESDAQHSLRKALAKFTTIEKMRVTVDGKTFESQATDWNTPFPVRDTDPDPRDKKSPPAGSDSASR
jgi:hypothetical protein